MKHPGLRPGNCPIGPGRQEAFPLRCGPSHAGAVAHRAGGRRVANQVVNIILEFGAAHLEFFDFLIGREINVLFDAVNGIVQTVVFVKHLPEMIIETFQAANGFAVFGKFAENGVMQVHGIISHSFLADIAGSGTGRWQGWRGYFGD